MARCFDRLAITATRSLRCSAGLRRLVVVSAVGVSWLSTQGHGQTGPIRNVVRAGDLHTAVRAGDLRRVQALLKAHPDLVNAPDSNPSRPLDRSRPLELAAEGGFKDLVVLLLAQGADVNAEGGDLMQGNGDFTALHHAKDKDVAEVLLAHGATVNAKTVLGITPLHTAAAAGRVGVVEYLLAHGANVNASHDDDGSTPLHWAAGNGHSDVAEVLLAHGANVNAEDLFHDRETPLASAVRTKGHKDLVEVLLAHGAAVDPKTSPYQLIASPGGVVGYVGGETPLDSAVDNGDKDVVQLLLNKGANVNHQSFDGTRPLHRAAHSGDKDLVELLLAHGAEVNGRGRDNLTPLHMVAISGAAITARKAVLTLLAAHGAEVNALSDEGETPLHLVQRNYLRGSTVADKEWMGAAKEIMELLRQNGGHE
jgi:ankyrin repeat protein